jgi:hypothetical protein
MSVNSQSVAHELAAMALTQKTIVEGLATLRPAVDRARLRLWTAWSAASVARLIASDVLPACDTFLASVDRVNTFLDERIARGELVSHPFIDVARRKIEAFRQARDNVTTLAANPRTGGVSRRTLVAAVTSMMRELEYEAA